MAQNISSKMDYFPYLYRGIVKINEDPKNLGRCKIHVPSIYGSYDYDASTLPWARPIAPGGVRVPNIGDIVWILFEGGRREAPAYLVGNVSEINPIESSTKDLIYKSGACEVSYDKENQSLLLRVDNNLIAMTPNEVEITGYDPDTGSGLGGNIYFDVVEVIEE